MPHGQDDGVGDQVAGEDPGALVDAGAEGSGDVGQSDVGDGGVEDFHEGGEGNGHGDEPGIDAGLPARLGEGLRVVERSAGEGRRCGLQCGQKRAPLRVLSACRPERFGSLPPRFAGPIPGANGARGMRKGNAHTWI